MSDTTPDDIAVTVCDWNGRLIWTSRNAPCCGAGNPIWEGAAPECAEAVRAAVSRVVALREPQQYEAANLRGEFFHVWMWPLDSPEIAVCMLAVRVPVELSLLSTRERDCLHLLGAGAAPGAIATALDISVSTTHTHLKRARVKLGIENIEALISFAARHCV